MSRELDATKLYHKLTEMWVNFMLWQSQFARAFDTDFFFVNRACHGCTLNVTSSLREMLSRQNQRDLAEKITVDSPTERSFHFTKFPQLGQEFYLQIHLPPASRVIKSLETRNEDIHFQSVQVGIIASILKELNQSWP